MFGGVEICDVLASDMASVICDDVTINSDRSQKNWSKNCNKYEYYYLSTETCRSIEFGHNTSVPLVLFYVNRLTI